MIGWTLNTFVSLMTGQAPNAGQTSLYPQEGIYDLFLRLKHELFWPRILVRCAPPPNGIQPIAPVRS